MQVLIPVAEDLALAAGLPAAVRNAHSARTLSPDRITLSAKDPAALRRWKAQLAGTSASNGTPLEVSGPLLVVSDDGFAEAEALRAFVDSAVKSPSPTRWVSEGRTAATYYPDGREADAAVYEGTGWWPVSDAASAARAEKALFDKLPRDTDGYLARFDRSVSMALSRLLVRTPVTPNQITTASLILGLLGAWALGAGSYPVQVGGAFLLWTCCILDGCDGEVARIKLLCSESGALYDVVADNIVHVAIFAAIPFNVQRGHPEARFLVPGLLLVTGFLACMFSVWWLVLRRPKDQRGQAGLVVERVASRDFIYLIFFLTAIGRLDWFLWAAAIGSHAFNLALWLMFGKGPSPAGSPAPPRESSPS